MCVDNKLLHSLHDTEVGNSSIALYNGVAIKNWNLLLENSSVNSPKLCYFS